MRAWYDLIDRGDGIYLARYRLFEELDSINIEVTLIDNKAQVAQSPYMIAGKRVRAQKVAQLSC